MAAIFRRRVGWEMQRDKDGHRIYTIRHLVETTDSNDGPAIVLTCPGLPYTGADWSIGNDVDVWAFCKLPAKVTPWKQKENDPVRFWIVEQTFSTEADASRCKDAQWDDPLLIPPEISIKYIKYQEEFTRDRFGVPLTNSAWEQLRGPQVEFDRPRMQVKIKMNVPAVNFPLLSSMVNTLNQFPLWGMPPRTIQLSEPGIERKFYGQCSIYYVLDLTFDVRAEGFDRDVLDEGTKVLFGHWDNTSGQWVVDNIGGKPANPFNPAHFMRFQDKAGNPARAVLNGRGLPAGVVTGTNEQFAATAGGAGHPLEDPDFWIPVAGDITKIPNWVPFTEYQRGQLVLEGGLVYICDDFKLFTLQPPSVDWEVLGAPPLTVVGQYNPATAYSVGDIVQGTTSTGPAGTRHIEAYGESDFLLLGIPTSF